MPYSNTGSEIQVPTKDHDARPWLNTGGGRGDRIGRKAAFGQGGCNKWGTETPRGSPTPTPRGALAVGYQWVRIYLDPKPPVSSASHWTRHDGDTTFCNASLQSARLSVPSAAVWGEEHVNRSLSGLFLTVRPWPATTCCLASVSPSLRTES